MSLLDRHELRRLTTETQREVTIDARLSRRGYPDAKERYRATSAQASALAQIESARSVSRVEAYLEANELAEDFFEQYIFSLELARAHPLISQELEAARTRLSFLRGPPPEPTEPGAASAE